MTEAALKHAPLVFVRPGELRKPEWAEFDLDSAEWRIPAQRMKMRQQHIVPLATQGVAILRDLHAFTCRSRYVFHPAKAATGQCQRTLSPQRFAEWASRVGK